MRNRVSLKSTLVLSFVLSATFLFFSAEALSKAAEPSPNALRIYQTAMKAARQSANVTLTGSLFGQRIRTVHNKFGAVSCAYVASAILGESQILKVPQACRSRVVPVTAKIGGRSKRLCGVRDSLSRFKLIKNKASLIKGDIVLWKANANRPWCLSKANNHIGIYVGKTLGIQKTVDASAIEFGAPVIRNLSRSCWLFDRAYRP